MLPPASPDDQGQHTGLEGVIDSPQTNGQRTGLEGAIRDRDGQRTGLEGADGILGGAGTVDPDNGQRTGLEGDEPVDQESDLLIMALRYAALGLHVFPCQPRTKVPIPGSHGCKDATDDQDKIIYWWLRWPDANLAIATGFRVDVIDIDGPVGVKSWGEIENLPVILGSVVTPREGGSQHFYIAATGKGNFAAIAPGIDYRGKGGYVIAPPSINVDGIRYRWRRPLGLSAP